MTLSDDFPAADSSRWTSWGDSEESPVLPRGPIVSLEPGVIFAYSEADGSWTEIGTTDDAHFDVVDDGGPPAYASLRMRVPEPEEVSGRSPAYARRDIQWTGVANDVWTVTFAFDPSGECGCGECVASAEPVTYLEETPEGGIVERIDHALQGWERWGDSMRWTP